MADERPDINRVQELIGLCEYHARKAAERHDFYVGKSRAADREECAKNTLGWAGLYADVAEALRYLTTVGWREEETKQLTMQEVVMKLVP